MPENSAILSPYGICTNKKRLEQQTQRKSSYSSENNFQFEKSFLLLAIFDCFFATQSCFSSVLTLIYLTPLRWYDAIMFNKRFWWRSYVEIQMAQKLVANKKRVKMKELLKQSLRYYIRMF